MRFEQLDQRATEGTALLLQIEKADREEGMSCVANEEGNMRETAPPTYER